MSPIKSFTDIEAGDLTGGQAVEFEAIPEPDDEAFFLDEEFDDFQSSLLNQFDNADSYSNEPNDVSYEELKKLMTPVTEDNGVLKEVIKCGEGGDVSENSIFVIHYALYVEGADQPFDSTWLREKPLKILPNGGGALPFLEISVATMKKGEVSRFLVIPEYAYGDIGVPPRIPPKATILCRIHVLSVYLCNDALKFEEMTMAQRREINFEQLVKIYHVENQIANEDYRAKQYKKAISRYNRAASLLEDVSVSSDEEDQKRKGYLFKLYLNLGISHIKLVNHHKAIIYSDLALKLQPRDPKALYRMGLAHLKAPSYERSEYYFKRVLSCGGEWAADAEKKLNELRRLRKRDLDIEKQYCRRMFGNVEKDKPSNVAIRENEILEDLTPEMRGFAEGFLEELKEFQFSNERELSLSAGLTDEELEVVQKFLAGRDKLAFVKKTMNGEKIHKIAKNEAYEY